MENICFDLYDVLDEVSTIFDIKAKEKDLIFEQERVPELARLHVGDPGKVKQVLYNLVGNAVKFTEKGSVHLTVHPGATITLAVAFSAVIILITDLDRPVMSFFDINNQLLVNLYEDMQADLRLEYYPAD